MTVVPPTRCTGMIISPFLLLEMNGNTIDVTRMMAASTLPHRRIIVFDCSVKTCTVVKDDPMRISKKHIKKIKGPSYELVNMPNMKQINKIFTKKHMTNEKNDHAIGGMVRRNCVTGAASAFRHISEIFPLSSVAPRRSISRSLPVCSPASIF